MIYWSFSSILSIFMRTWTCKPFSLRSLSAVGGDCVSNSGSSLHEGASVLTVPPSESSPTIQIRTELLTIIIKVFSSHTNRTLSLRPHRSHHWNSHLRYPCYQRIGLHRPRMRLVRLNPRQNVNLLHFYNQWNLFIS